MTVIAITGHRPEDSEPETIVRLKFQNVWKEVRPSGVVTGMASGVDLWAADEAQKLGIVTIGAKPWAGHKPRIADRELYEKVWFGCLIKHECNESLDYPGPWIYSLRNKWMVDYADRVCAYWSGKEKGGTYDCVKYARGRKPIRNIYDTSL